MIQNLIQSSKDLLTSVGLKRTKGRDIILHELETRKDHSQLICEHCGKVIDFPCESIEFLNRR